MSTICQSKFTSFVAVQHPPDTPLQILAGPGSGKTKVLTSRIAHLILQHSLAPSSICAVTFTNKAANEMRERLVKLIGKGRTDEVKMGTFHALCALFLRKYGTVVGLDRNFTICDAEESKKIIMKLLKPYKEFLTASNITLKEGTVLSLISRAKAKGLSADDLRTRMTSNESRKRPAAKVDPPESFLPPGDTGKIVVDIYMDYERVLRKSNSLDFDDLLVYGVKLFAQHQKAVQWCRHVLVDEFQDTNIMQYELMRHLAATARCVTVVGDPDQSIYGWRSAEIANLFKMKKDFPSTEQIFLEENYRSTSSILAASLAIVSQDKARIPKTLHTSHSTGPLPVLRSFPSEHEEATFIAVEMKRIVANMGGMLGWGDFIVLLRFNALSRAIESALQKEAIPSRILGGHKFFERLEIKDLLAYLQLVDNPHYGPAFSRAVNVPSRGIGEKTLAEILVRVEKLKLTPLAVVEDIHDAKIPDIKPPVKNKLASFIKIIRVLRGLANKRNTPADLIRRLLELTEYEDHLRKTQPDWETRWENVQELINFASEVEVNSRSESIEGFDAASHDGNVLDLMEETGDGEMLAADNKLKIGSSLESTSSDTPLRLFLQDSMLSSEGDKDQEGGKEKVTIATCHAAKGLEWPVVMIPAAEKGIFPFYRSDDLEEERRLLYVACTRAQGLLYLSYATQRKFAGESQTKEVSEFVSAAVKENQELLTAQLPVFQAGHRATIAKVLGRPIPDESEIQRRVTEFKRIARYQAYASDQSVDATSKPSLPPTSVPPPNYVPSFRSSSAYLPASIALPKSSALAGEPPSSARNHIGNSAVAGPSAVRSRSGSNFIHTTQSTMYKGNIAPAPDASAGSRSRTQIDSPSVPPPRSLGIRTPPRSQLPAALEKPKAVDVAGGEESNPGGVKRRRLGMGRAVIGYPSKKFKLPR